MAAPVIELVYPADSDTGIPIGATLYVIFDKGIDLESAKANVILYGADFDQTSGPDTALWIDGDTGDNPFFLTSPGFSGVAGTTMSLVYVDLDDNSEITLTDVTGEAYEGAYGGSGAGHKLKIVPDEPLAVETEYTLYINGDPDSIGRGVSSRTVFDVIPTVGNTSSTGLVHTSGVWGNGTTDTIWVKITTSGDINVAKYKWWRASEGEAHATYGRVASPRYRTLEDGLYIRFSGSGFVAGDTFSFNVEPAERLTTSTSITFTTNDGSYVAAPDSPSTPATSSPPSSVLPPGAGSQAAADSTLYVYEMDPPDDSYQNPLTLRRIEIVCSADLNPYTINDETVQLWRYPILGVYEGQRSPLELAKKITVSGNMLILEF